MEVNSTGQTLDDPPPGAGQWAVTDADLDAGTNTAEATAGGYTASTTVDANVPK